MTIIWTIFLICWVSSSFCSLIQKLNPWPMQVHYLGYFRFFGCLTAVIFVRTWICVRMYLSMCVHAYTFSEADIETKYITRYI